MRELQQQLQARYPICTILVSEDRSAMDIIVGELIIVFIEALPDGTWGVSNIYEPQDFGPHDAIVSSDKVFETACTLISQILRKVAT